MKKCKLLIIYFLFFLAVFLLNEKTAISENIDQCLKDHNWYKLKDSNYYTKGFMENKPKYIVIHHSTSKKLSKIKKVFEENNVSCHYFIDNNGKLHNIINDKCVVYHAGNSYWNGEYKLNNSSVCIEILNDSPFTHDISNKQYKTLIKILKKLKKKYNIKNNNIVSHSDIAYFSDDGLYNRKQDISYLFDWKKLYKNNVGFWYNDKKVNKNNYDVLYYFGDEKDGIINIKKKLKMIGYKIDNIDNKYDINLFMLSIVFHRRFFPEQLIMAGQGLWTKSSTNVLNLVIEELKKENIN